MRFFYILILFSIFHSSALANAHFFQTSVQLLEKNLAHSQNLIVKIKDDRQLSFGHPYIFVNGELFLPNLPFRFRVMSLLDSHQQKSKLQNYLFFHFDKPVTVKQAFIVQSVLEKIPEVEFFYFQPIYSNAGGLQNQIGKRGPTPFAAPASTPDFIAKQFYLEPLPYGIEAQASWALPGGRGENVKIIDVEIGWQVEHEDFNTPFFSFLQNEVSSHGTAVWGVVAARDDGQGMTGIAHNAQMGVSSVLWEGSFKGYIPNLVAAIDRATQELEAGDVMIIEQQAPGPQNSNHAPVEYWPAVFDAIQLATAKGIHVVAAAANGHSDLDHKDYKGAFDIKVRDSGAILVGAVGSPLKGRYFERMSYSNYGKRVTSFAYGQDVATAGYGDLFDQGPTRIYTDGFAGTSSATPIVAGAVALASSLAKQRGKSLRPEELREILATTGPRQDGDRKQNVGRFPNLPEIIDTLNL
ncbi:MAG: S8 family serine peptidase [Bdellovibrionales bacterium]|nr:S8 family serine peptidase [Bdellovibrionales bacterium]